jgi:hypothetical protein
MIRIDAYVLDKCFQPIINWCGQHPLDFGLNAAIGGSVMLYVAVVGLTRWASPLAAILGLTAIFVIGFSLGLLASTLARLRPIIVPGMRNPMRFVLLPLRLGSMVAVPWMTVSIVLLPDFAFIAMGGALWIASVFFVSCDCPPFQPKRVRRPSFWRLKLADI